MVRYACHCVCYVKSFQMSGNIMGLACVSSVFKLSISIFLCSLCIRGADFDFGEVFLIDYSPYLLFKQKYVNIEELHCIL